MTTAVAEGSEYTRSVVEAVGGILRHMRGIREIALLCLGALLLSGCVGQPPGAAPTATSDVVSSPSASSNAQEPDDSAVEPPSDDGNATDWSTALRAESDAVTGVIEGDAGSVEVTTNLSSGIAELGTSIVEAIALCQNAVELGAERVVITDAAGMGLVAYGDTDTGDLCTEIDAP